MNVVPFRWDLVTPDQLGSLLTGTTAPDLWFLPELVECAGKVLARSGNGDLVFVGRSLDSMFDLLGGAAGARSGPRTGAKARRNGDAKAGRNAGRDLGGARVGGDVGARAGVKACGDVDGRIGVRARGDVGARNGVRARGEVGAQVGGRAGGKGSGGVEVGRLLRLPFSFQRGMVGDGRRRSLSASEVAHARYVLGTLGLAPRSLARRRRPVTFVDVVSEGGTFTELFGLLHDWITEERESWPVVRRKLRFAGVTIRRHTSPNTWRWQQHVPWTGRLPARSVVNVSLAYPVWSYFGDHQTKLTSSYTPDRWEAADGPRRDERTRQALAEAAAVVAYGRSSEGRHSLARAIGKEPALSEAWLRGLVTVLKQA